MPGAQSAHTAEPGALEVCWKGSGQPTHVEAEDAPTAEENVPEGHSVHDPHDALTAEDHEPSAQGTHAEAAEKVAG